MTRALRQFSCLVALVAGLTSRAASDRRALIHRLSSIGGLMRASVTFRHSTVRRRILPFKMPKNVPYRWTVSRARWSSSTSSTRITRTVCPLHAEKIAAVQNLLNRTALRDRVRFVTITTDPARDSPDVLRTYGPQHGLGPANWVFLTSGQDRPNATGRIAEAFGHRFVVTSDGLQMHGMVTHVIDRYGRLRANCHGLGFDDANLVLFVIILAGHEHPAAASDQGSVPLTASYWTKLRGAVLGW